MTESAAGDGQPCPKCGGKGEVVSMMARVQLRPCSYCKGTGIHRGQFCSHPKEAS